MNQLTDEEHHHFEYMFSAVAYGAYQRGAIEPHEFARIVDVIRYLDTAYLRFHLASVRENIAGLHDQEGDNDLELLVAISGVDQEFDAIAMVTDRFKQFVVVLTINALVQSEIAFRENPDFLKLDG